MKGDPTEGALLSFASKAGVSYKDMASFERHHEEPFDSETKIMSVVCKENESLYKFSKGSVEAILTRCNGINITVKSIRYVIKKKRSFYNKMKVLQNRHYVY